MKHLPANVEKTFSSLNSLRNLTSVESTEPKVAVVIMHLLSLVILLYPLIAILHLSSLTYSCLNSLPEVTIFAAGYVASSLIGSIYFGLLTSSIRRFKRKKSLILKAWICSLLLILIPIVFAEIAHRALLMNLVTVAFVILNICFSSTPTGALIARGASLLAGRIKNKM